MTAKAPLAPTAPNGCSDPGPASPSCPESCPPSTGWRPRSTPAAWSPTSAAAPASRSSHWPNGSRRSHVHGYDISRHAIERAQRLVADAKVDNVTFHLAGADTLPTDATFDLVLTLDCLHDMTKPDRDDGRHPPIDPPRRHLARQRHPLRIAGRRTTSPTRWRR